MAPVVGLIGGIGAGKSAVAAAFARHGARIVAADPLGHEALRQPEIKARVVARWGSAVLSSEGEIDRRKVAAIVFAEPAERKALESMVFPWIKRRLREEIDKARAVADVKLIVLDAAIMIEAAWSEACDRLVFVDAPRELRLQRLAGQRGWSPQEIEARENAQMPVDEKRSRADFVIDNRGSPQELDRQVEQLLKSWKIGANA